MFGNVSAKLITILVTAASLTFYQLIFQPWWNALFPNAGFGETMAGYVVVLIISSIISAIVIRNTRKRNNEQ